MTTVLLPVYLGLFGIALLTSWAIVCASRTMASPPMAAKAASLALSIRRGLPLAVMYRNPAHARNNAAAARPTLVAASSKAVKTWVIADGSLMLFPFLVE